MSRRRTTAPGSAAPPPAGAGRRLARSHNLWMATVRPDGRPHLAPVWFVWVEGTFFVCTAPGSVKARNLRADGRVVVSLENAYRALICEALGAEVRPPWPKAVVAAFRVKYDWKIRTDSEYSRLLRLTPRRWIAW